MSFANPAVAGALSREETEAAYRKHLVAKGNYSGSWDALTDNFAEDASYYDVVYGWMHGRDAIRTFLKDSMKGIEDWSFPVQWEVITEGRVVAHWLNRLPGGRPDGTFYEFPGMSAITYDSRGQISQQMDIYSVLAAVKVIMEARTGAVGRAALGAVDRLSTAGREGMRLVYTAFDRSR